MNKNEDLQNWKTNLTENEFKFYPRDVSQHSCFVVFRSLPKDEAKH